MSTTPAAFDPSEARPGTVGRETRRRDDIDGLRAVAVAGVVLFHYGLVPLRGGFSGVDVFFTISGFLIATVLDADLARGRFSAAGFYERRVRRILPALLLVLLACGLACTRHLPNDLKRIGLGLMNAVGFTSNIYFTSIADNYFAAGSLTIQPALHTWSLGVEAQFYALFPWLWIGGRRRPRRRAAGLAALGAASFGLGLWGVAHWPEGTFYLLPARMWEFLLGAVVVLLPRPALTRPARGAAAGAGLVLVGAGFALLGPATPFPGAAALLPCCGTALAIQAGRMGPNPVSAGLGSPPLAMLGRASYALYLWHWPVLVLATYGRFDPPPAAERLGLLALALLLAAATYALVERPVIERRRLAGPRALVLACGAGSVACLSVGLAVNLAGQKKLSLAPFPPEVVALSDGQFDFNHRDCLVADLSDPECRFGAPGVEPSVAIWGNSFAGMWTRGLDGSAKRHGAAGVSLWLSSCPPLVDVRFPQFRGCDTFNPDALAFVEAHPGLKTVVLAADWGRWVDALPMLARTVDRLTALNRAVVVVRTPPLNGYDVPRVLAVTALYGSRRPPLLTEAEARRKRAAEDAVLDGIRAAHPFAVLDPAAVLCDGATCAVERGGRSLYYDEKHINRAGAAMISALFDPVFDGAGAKPSRFGKDR